MPRMPWTITPDMYLDLQEVDSLLSHVRAAAKSGPSREMGPALDRVIIETLLFSGIRNSELCRLLLRDLVISSSSCLLQVGCTGKESRQVYIPRHLGGVLEAYVAKVRPALLAADSRARDPARPLICNERGRAYERTGLYRRVTRVLEEAGLGERASVQLLRHTYGYLAYKQTGGNLLFVQRQLGHAHPMITSVYAQLVEERYEDLAEMICPAGKNVCKPRRHRK